jgi:hypothetical protein
MSNTPQTFKNGAIALVIALFLIALGALGSYFLLKRHFQAISDTFKPDTVEVIKYDTLNILKPVEIEKIKYLTEKVPVYIHDTLNHVDTFYAQREQRVYGDSLYRAVVSGVDPRLDSLSIYRKTIDHYVTKKVTVKRPWGIGVQLGYGLPIGVEGYKTYPYVGIGISYNILSW